MTVNRTVIVLTLTPIAIRVCLFFLFTLLFLSFFSLCSSLPPFSFFLLCLFLLYNFFPLYFSLFFLIDRNILIFVLDDGETWSQEGENRKATKKDVERWGKKHEIRLWDWIGVVSFRSWSMVGKSVSRLFVSDSEFEAIKGGRNPAHSS